VTSSLPKSLRIAVSAFAVHALLLLVDLLFFGAAYAGNRENDRWEPLRGSSRPRCWSLCWWGLGQRGCQA
jgi:hypothetical protein